MRRLILRGKRNAVVGSWCGCKGNTMQDARSNVPIMQPYVKINFKAERAQLKDLLVIEVGGLVEEDGGEGMEEEES